MKKSLLVIVLIVLSATISYSQVVDSTYEEEYTNPLGGYSRKDFKTFSLDYLGQNSSLIRGGRFNIEIMEDYYGNVTYPTRNIEFNLFSIAVNHDYQSTLKVSSNLGATLLAFGAVALIAQDTIKEFGFKNIVSSILLGPIIIHMITNPSYKIKLIHKKLELIVGVNTDYFFFYDVSRIYSEASIGLRGRFNNIALSANLGVPFTKGYFENKNPYFGVSALYYFERY